MSHILSDTKIFFIFFDILFFFLLTYLIIRELLVKSGSESKAYAKISVLFGFLIFGFFGALRATFIKTGSLAYYEKEIITGGINVAHFTAFLWLLSLFFFLAGYSFSIQNKWVDSIPVPKKNLPVKRIFLSSLVLFLIALAGHFYKGSIEYSVISKGINNIKNYNHIIETIETLMIPSALMGIYCLAYTKNIFIKSATVAVISYSIIAMFLTGVRLNMLYIIFPGIFFGYFVMSKKEKSVKHKFYIVASIAAAALIMGMFIQYILRDEGFYHFNKDSFDNRLMRLTRWEPVDAYDNSMFLVSLIPHNIDYLYGKSLYSLLVNPIPRKLWPGKPTDFGLFMASLRDSSYIKGLAGSLTGESYANFGIAGVVLIFLIFGSAVRLFHQIYARHRDNNFVILIYSAGLISICFMQIRGQLLTVNTQFIYLIFVPLYLGLLF